MSAHLETRKLCEVRFDNVAVPQTALLGWPALARVYDGAAVALSAEICGGAQRVLEMTVEYAKLREAFGKPIGSYQGVKHRSTASARRRVPAPALAPQTD